MSSCSPYYRCALTYDYPQNVSSMAKNNLALQFTTTSWSPLTSISVDREGNFLYTLRPKLHKVSHRLMCDIKLVNNIKVITFRSTFMVENRTGLPVEVVVVDANGKPTASIFKIGESVTFMGERGHSPDRFVQCLAPGEDCPIPIEAAYHKRIKIRPDRECPFQCDKAIDGG